MTALAEFLFGNGRVAALAALMLMLGMTSADAYISCALVQWAVTHLSKETLDAYIAQATPEQLKEGRACLGEAHKKVARHAHKKRSRHR